MAGGANEDADELITQINVVPLVDIILVVLIIFMLTANIIAKQSLKVELPDAATV
jgi:biopolymer transport protein ExbD